MARYTLKAYDNESHKETEIPVLENGIYKYKVRLQAIDFQTLYNGVNYIKNKEDYLNNLNDLGYDLSSKTIFYITYKDDGKELQVPVVFGSNMYIEYFSFFYTKNLGRFDSNTVNTNDETAKEERKQKIYNEIFKDKIWQELHKLFMDNIVNDEYFYRFLKHKIDPFHYTSIKDYVKSAPKKNIFGNDIFEDDDDSLTNNISKTKIKDMLTSYKNLRTIILAREEYAIKNDVEFGIDVSMVANEFEQLRYEFGPRELYFGPDDHQIKVEDVYTDEEVQEMLPDNRYQEYINGFEKQKTLESK